MADYNTGDKKSRDLQMRSSASRQPAEPAEREKARDVQMRASINQQLVETGEREKLKELLRVRLSECGWRDQLKQHCKEVIKQRGLEHVTVDDLVQEITPKARQLVPDTVKKELLHRIRTFLAKQSNL